MSTEFHDFEDALDHIRRVYGLGEDFSFEEIPAVQVEQLFSDLLVKEAEKPDATNGDRLIAQGIKNTLAAQRTYRVMQNGEEHAFPMEPLEDGKEWSAVFHFTIGPFGEGVDCWMSRVGSKYATRF